MIAKIASMLAVTAMCTACSTDSVAWSVPTGSAASGSGSSSAYVQPANTLAADIAFPQAAAAAMAGHSHAGHSMAGMQMAAADAPAAAAAPVDHSKMDHSKMNHGAAAPAAAPAGTSVPATGKVKSIDAAKRTIKLAHEPIPQLGWPVMVMDFPLAKDVDLKGIKPDMDVKFSLKEVAKGEYTVDSISEDHTHHYHGDAAAAGSKK